MLLPTSTTVFINLNTVGVLILNLFRLHTIFGFFIIIMIIMQKDEVTTQSSASKDVGKDLGTVR